MFDEGEPAGELFEIAGGVVKLYKLMADGRCQVIGFLYSGQILGLSVGERYAYTAEAVGAVKVLRYARRPFERLVDADPALARQLLGTISDELKAAQDHLLLLGRKSAGERVASFLLSLSDRSQNGDVVDIPMTRCDIADYLGLTTETVSRTFSQFKARGIITMLSLRRAAIAQPDLLRDAAEGVLEVDALPCRRESGTSRAAWPIEA